MSGRKRRAFTLVELLVVIVIIGMLVGLLIPAVLAAREAARQTQCMNNQKELSSAVMQYELAKDRLPGYVNTVDANAPDDVRIQVSWATVLLPYLGRTDLWRLWRDGNLIDGNVFIKQLVCPSNAPSSIVAGSPPLSYVINAGLIDTFPTSGRNTTSDSRLLPVSELSRDGGSLVPREAYNGTCHYLLTNQSGSLGGLTVSVEYVSSHDGAQNTLLLAENLIEKSWAVNPEIITPSPMSSEKAWGFCWEWATDLNDENTGLNKWRIDRHISSNHPGKVIVSFCDGHQYQLSNNIHYRVYQHLMTPDSQQARQMANDGINVYGTLSEDDY